MDYEAFPEPEQIKSNDPKYTLGKNKSKRPWKLGVNRKTSKAKVSQSRMFS